MSPVLYFSIFVSFNEYMLGAASVSNFTDRYLSPRCTKLINFEVSVFISLTRDFVKDKVILMHLSLHTLILYPNLLNSSEEKNVGENF